MQKSFPTLKIQKLIDLIKDDFVWPGGARNMSIRQHRTLIPQICILLHLQQNTTYQLICFKETNGHRVASSLQMGSAT